MLHRLQNRRMCSRFVGIERCMAPREPVRGGGAQTRIRGASMNRFFQYAAVGCIFSLRLLGQTGLATLTGVVTDPTSAVIGGATVRATHIETGTVLTAVSSTSGNYVITQMPIGRYSVTTEAMGF